MQSSRDVKVFTRNIRTGKFETSILPFVSLAKLKADLDSIYKLSYLKIVKVHVQTPTLHFSISKAYPTLKVIFV